MSSESNKRSFENALLSSMKEKSICESPEIDGERINSPSKTVKKRKKYSENDDKHILDAVMEVNDQPFGRGLTGRKIWLKIQKRCQNIESLKNRSVNSLKFRFLEHIKPKLSDNSATMDSDNSDSSLSSSDTSVPRKRIVKEKKIKKEDKPYNKEKKAKKIENKDESYNKEEQYNETAETPANDETKKGSIEQKKKIQDQANPNDTEELNSEGKYCQLFEKADETLKKLESNVKITENSLTCVKRQRDKNSTKDKSKKSQKEMLTSTPKPLKRKQNYTENDDKEILRAVLKENGTGFGFALTKHKIWEKITKRCHKIEKLKNDSASSLKYQFFEHIQPKLTSSNFLSQETSSASIESSTPSRSQIKPKKTEDMNVDISNSLSSKLPKNLDDEFAVKEGSVLAGTSSAFIESSAPSFSQIKQKETEGKNFDISNSTSKFPKNLDDEFADTEESVLAETLLNATGDKEEKTLEQQE